MTDLPDDVKRWTAKRRSALVLSILRGETSVQEAGGKHVLTVAEVEEWQERFLLAAENAFRSRPRHEEVSTPNLLPRDPAATKPPPAAPRRSLVGELGQLIRVQ